MVVANGMIVAIGGAAKVMVLAELVTLMEMPATDMVVGVEVSAEGVVVVVERSVGCSCLNRRSCRCR